VPFIIFAFLAALAAVLIDIFMENKGSGLILLLWMLKVPGVVMEYFFLFWYTAGGSKFTLIAIPVVLFVFFILQLSLFMTTKNKLIKTIMLNLLIAGSPPLCLLTVNLIAALFHIDIYVS
jgi:hypothetical protein